NERRRPLPGGDLAGRARNRYVDLLQPASAHTAGLARRSRKLGARGGDRAGEGRVVFGSVGAIPPCFIGDVICPHRLFTEVGGHRHELPHVHGSPIEPLLESQLRDCLHLRLSMSAPLHRTSFAFCFRARRRARTNSTNIGSTDTATMRMMATSRLSCTTGTWPR